MTRITHALFVLGFVGSVGGCAAHRAPLELVDARDAHERAHHGPAVQANTRGLDAADQALEEAERSFSDDPGSEETKHRAYLAHRLTLRAEAEARAEIARAQRVQAETAVTEMRTRGKADVEPRRLDQLPDGSTRKARLAPSPSSLSR